MFCQLLETIASASEMTVKVPSGRVADIQFLGQLQIIRAPLIQARDRFRVPVELPSVEGGRFLQQMGVRLVSQFPFHLRDALTERQPPRQLDKADEVAATTAAPAVAQILVSIHFE